MAMYSRKINVESTIRKSGDRASLLLKNIVTLRKSKIGALIVLRILEGFYKSGRLAGCIPSEYRDLPTSMASTYVRKIENPTELCGSCNPIFNLWEPGDKRHGYMIPRSVHSHENSRYFRSR